VHEQGLEGVADARTLHLRIVHELDRPVLAGARVEEHVHHARAGLDDGHLRLVDDGAYEAGTPARDEHVDVLASLHEVAGAGATEIVDRLHCVGRQPD
jgi:hypothetical protein